MSSSLHCTSNNDSRCYGILLWCYSEGHHPHKLHPLTATSCLLHRSKLSGNPAKVLTGWKRWQYQRKLVRCLIHNAIVTMITFGVWPGDPTVHNSREPRELCTVSSPAHITCINHGNFVQDWYKFKMSYQDFVSQAELWSSSFKAIEGKIILFK